MRQEKQYVVNKDGSKKEITVKIATTKEEAKLLLAENKKEFPKDKK